MCAFLEASAAQGPKRADSDALGWRLPYVVALLLDSAQLRSPVRS